VKARHRHSQVVKALAYQGTLQGYNVRYVDADSAFAHYSRAGADEQRKLLGAMIETDLLVLDDLFLARRIAAASAELLQAVVHQRSKLRRAIVVTSN
jgi:DNA replication protein DnaC